MIIGGGLGLAPLLYYAKCVEQSDVLMGGRTASEMFWTSLFKPYVKNLYVTTDDGTMGEQGFAIDMLPQILGKNSYDCLIACGPPTMMQLAAKIAKDNDLPCQVSLEVFHARLIWWTGGKRKSAKTGRCFGRRRCGHE